MRKSLQPLDWASTILYWDMFKAFFLYFRWMRLLIYWPVLHHSACRNRVPGISKGWGFVLPRCLYYNVLYHTYCKKFNYKPPCFFFLFAKWIVCYTTFLCTMSSQGQHRKTNSLSTFKVNLNQPDHLFPKCMALDCGRKPDYSRKTCKRHAEKFWAPKELMQLCLNLHTNLK